MHKKNSSLALKILLFTLLLISIKCQLTIIGPSDLSSKFPDKQIEINYGKIGTSQYDFSTRGKLYLQNDNIFNTKRNGCIPIINLNILLNETNFSENFKILLVNNGGCSIVQKTRNAQKAGFSMLIIINNVETNIKNIIMTDDGYGSDIHIPVIMISKNDGDILIKYMEMNKNEKVIVEINFNNKKVSEKVDFKFFFSSSEKKAYDLINNLKQYIHKFNDQVIFTPIYVVHPDPLYDKEKSKNKINCVSKGKYCYFPKKTTITQDGVQIIMEDLRQKCFYKMNKNNLNNYFNYLNNFYYQCITEGPNYFNEKCSKKILENLGYPKDILDDCISSSFGTKNLDGYYIDNENTILENDYNEIINFQLTSFPAVIINKNLISGAIKETNIIIEICNVVKIKPKFCSFLTGDTDEHILFVKNRKSLIYSLIIILIVVNLFIFFVCRKYVLQRIKEKIDQGGIDIDGRIKNIIGNYFSLTKMNNDYVRMQNNPSSFGDLSNQTGKVVDIAIGSK